MKVYGAVWFSQMGTTDSIGIVTFNNGHEDKAYIGIVNGTDEKEDIKQVLLNGSPFPFAQAIALTGGK